MLGSLDSSSSFFLDVLPTFSDFNLQVNMQVK